MKKYFKQHFIVIITLVISIIASVIINFINEVSLEDNLIIALLVLLITTFVFDFNIILDKIRDKIYDYNHRLNPSSVLHYDSVDLCANAVNKIIKGDKHDVDFVSLDTKIRTQMKSKRRPMVRLLNKFVTSEKIKLRYLTAINSENYKTILDFIIASNSSQKESYYAICNSNVPFASFYIIDKKYLVIRTPYNANVKKHYCIIDDTSICGLFVSWFEMLWQNSEVIDTENDLRTIYNQLSNELSPEQKDMLEKLLENAIKFFN